MLEALANFMAQLDSKSQMPVSSDVRCCCAGMACSFSSSCLHTTAPPGRIAQARKPTAGLSLVHASVLQRMCGHMWARSEVSFFASNVCQIHHLNPCSSLSVPVAGLKGYRPDAIIMDAPRIYHLPKAVPLLAVQGMLVALFALTLRE